jgi:glyoxylase-like metal-dependent hydrolase (beta-lactamase superfamily II)
MQTKLIVGFTVFVISFLFSLFCVTKVYALGEIGEGYKVFTLGDLTVISLSDTVGEMPFGIFSGATEEELSALAKEGGENGKFTSWINAFLIIKDNKLFLVDTGVGATKNLEDRIIKAGYDPTKVDYVLITHFHGDHIGGLVKNEEAVYPNATLYVPKIDANYFMPASGSVNGTELALKAVSPYVKANKYVPFEDNTEIAPGVAPIKLYGHTPGHSGFYFEYNGGTLLAWGDIVHAYLVQFARPEVTLSYDVTPSEAAATRLQLYNDLVNNMNLVVGAHLPFPAIGTVEKTADVFKWVPLPTLEEK